MTNYQLDKDVADSFEFSLGGFTYKMRYPTGEDRRAMAKSGQALQRTIREAEEAEQANDNDKLEALQKQAEQQGAELSKVFNALISSDDEKAPSIEDVLENASTPVQRNFNKMLETELSIEVPTR